MASRGASSKQKRLRWAHVTNKEVQGAVSGLLENTVVVLPETCVLSAGLEPNINDKNQHKKLWLGRLKQLPYLLTAKMLEGAENPDEMRRTVLQSAVHTVETCRAEGDSWASESVAAAMSLAARSDEDLATIARAAIKIQSAWRGARLRAGQQLLDMLDDYFGGCVIKGCVLFLCGSTGIAGDSLRYVRLLAGMGYLVIAPDHMAGRSGLFRRKAAGALLRYEDDTDYWRRNLLYEDAGAAGELVYSSSSRNFIDDPAHFDAVYNNVITIRQAGLALVLRKLPPFMRRHGVFLFGMSEGAVVLSSFHDDMYSDMLRGRIVCSYTCEQNYWNYNRPEDAGIAGAPTIPSLNIVGYSDEYFGYQDSVSTSVARVGDYAPITGNAFDAFVAAGLEWGLVAHLEGGRHALTWTHDDVIRELLSDFLERPQYTCRQLPQLWGHIPTLQDEITRVRRSADGKVTYIRIRPPTPDEVVAPQDGKPDDLTGLLNMLNKQLYQLEHDLPIELEDLEREILAAPERGSTRRGACREGVAPQALAVRHLLHLGRRGGEALDLQYHLQGADQQGRRQRARRLFHIGEAKREATAAAANGHAGSAPSWNGGGPPGGEAAVAVREGAHAPGSQGPANTMQGSGPPNGGAKPTPASATQEPSQAALPRPIINTSLAQPVSAAAGASLSTRRSFHEQASTSGGGRRAEWAAEARASPPRRLHRAGSRRAGAEGGSYAELAAASVASSCADGAAGPPESAPVLCDTLMRTMAKQAEASCKTQAAVHELARAMSTVAAASAVSSAVTAAALLAALGLGLFRAKPN
eukprot:jgi/Tetstr1/445774/TSEL_033421.t1